VREIGKVLVGLVHFQRPLEGDGFLCLAFEELEIEAHLRHFHGLRVEVHAIDAVD